MIFRNPAWISSGVFIPQIFALYKSARIPPQTPPAGGKFSFGFAKSKSPEKWFGKTKSALKPHHLPEELRAESRKNVLILLEEKIRPSPSQKSGEHFLRDTRAERAVVGLIDSFSDFENRCELGKIETPIQNEAAFSETEGGTREAHGTSFVLEIGSNLVK